MISVDELKSLRDRLAAEVKELDAMIAREKAYASDAARTGSPIARTRIP